jgi:hypothetical protein
VSSSLLVAADVLSARRGRCRWQSASRPAWRCGIFRKLPEHPTTTSGDTLRYPRPVLLWITSSPCWELLAAPVSPVFAADTTGVPDGFGVP